MPQLSEQQFNAAVQRAMAKAPPGLTEEQFNALVDQEIAQSTPVPSHRQAGADGILGQVERAAGRPRGLATIGGMVGGMAGGARATPVGIALAGMGGAMGEGVQQTIDAMRNPIRKVDSGMDAVRQSHQPLIDMAQAGIEQAGLEGFGRGASGLLMKGGRRLYSGLLKARQGVRDSFGADEVVDTLMENRAPITQGGLRKIQGRLGDSRAAALAAVGAADDAGMRPIAAHEVISEFSPVVGELRKRIDIGQNSELKRVGERGSALVRTANRGHHTGIPLRRAQELKETAQEAASGAYRQLERGTAKQLGADDLLDEATARGLRRSLEDRVPMVASHNTRTQSLLGGKRALEDAIEREANNGMVGMRDLIAFGAAGGAAAAGQPEAGIAGGVGMRLLSTPSAGSMIAIGAKELSKIPYAQLIRAALLAQLGRDEEED